MDNIQTILNYLTPSKNILASKNKASLGEPHAFGQWKKTKGCAESNQFSYGSLLFAG